MTCPHKVASEHGVVPAPHRNTQNPAEYVFERQLVPRIRQVSNEMSRTLLTVFSSGIAINSNNTAIVILCTELFFFV